MVIKLTVFSFSCLGFSHFNICFTLKNFCHFFCNRIQVSFIKELWDVCSFFFVAPTEYDEKTVKKRWKEDSAKCMTELAEVIAGIEDFSIEGQEKVVMDWIAEKGYHTGNIMNAFRLTLVGEGKGPHMFDISWVLGKEETIARMKRAVEVLK